MARRQPAAGAACDGFSRRRGCCGIAGNTVVIFNGDNGYYKGSRGFAGKWSHYEESLRVPLVVFDPRFEILPGTKGPAAESNLNDFEAADTVIVRPDPEPATA